MTRYCVLDFETKDPYISLGLGAGWIYDLHSQYSLFKVLGFGFLTIADSNIGEATYLDLNKVENIESIKELLESHDGVIMHNAQYDLGCLKALKIKIDHLKVYDTKIMAQLYNNTLNSYSLDYLSKKYLPKELQKDQQRLIESVALQGLLKSPSGKTVSCTNKTFPERALKWAYQNMDVLQELDFETIAHYAKMDVIATANLFNYFLEE